MPCWNWQDCEICKSSSGDCLDEPGRLRELTESSGCASKRLERAAVVAWGRWFSDPWEKEHPLVKADWIATIQAGIEAYDQEDTDAS